MEEVPTHTITTTTVDSASSSSSLLLLLLFLAGKPTSENRAKERNALRNQKGGASHASQPRRAGAKEVH